MRHKALPFILNFSAICDASTPSDLPKLRIQAFTSWRVQSRGSKNIRQQIDLKNKGLLIFTNWQSIRSHFHVCVLTIWCLHVQRLIKTISVLIAARFPSLFRFRRAARYRRKINTRRNSRKETSAIMKTVIVFKLHLKIERKKSGNVSKIFSSGINYKFFSFSRQVRGIF